MSPRGCVSSHFLERKPATDDVDVSFLAEQVRLGGAMLLGHVDLELIKGGRVQSRSPLD